MARVGLHIKIKGHAVPYMVDLRLFVIGGDPDVVGPDREQGLPRLDAVGAD